MAQLSEENKKKLMDLGTLIAEEVIDDIKTGKKWYESRTIWANAGVMAITGLVILGVSDPIVQQIAEVGGLCGLAVVNVALRFITKEPIEL